MTISSFALLCVTCAILAPSGVAMTPAFIDQHVQRTGPAGDEAAHRRLVRQVQRGHEHPGARCAPGDLLCGGSPGLDRTDGDGDLGAVRGKGASRLQADPGGAAGDDRPEPAPLRSRSGRKAASSRWVLGVR